MVREFRPGQRVKACGGCASDWSFNGYHHAALSLLPGSVVAPEPVSGLGALTSEKAAHFWKWTTPLLGSAVLSFAAFSMAMMLRGMPVLPSHITSLPVMPLVSKALAASHSGSRERSTRSLPSWMTE